MTSSQTMELAVGLISRKKVQFGFLLQLFSVHSVQSAAAAYSKPISSVFRVVLLNTYLFPQIQHNR